MYNFKRIIVSALLGGIISNNVNAQSELTVSAGNTVSSLVCGNSRVFVWGSNQGTINNVVQTGILGLTGTPASQAIVNTPTELIFPGTNPTIKQVNSGSGSHFVALDCNNSVWSWGLNDLGQVGNGTSGNIQSRPTQVKAGNEVSSVFKDANGNLTGANVVYAGLSNSFAILNDGTVVGWGANSDGASIYLSATGQLGDGTKINKLTPVFVRSGNTGQGQTTGQPLQGVKQIYTGDGVAYALVDIDGDGIGTVYSWGNGMNGSLGRNAAGTGNPASSVTVQDSYARPVCFPNGSPMNNIVTISAGDVFGMALDIDGYVWTWGNGGWNNATGNTTVNYTGSDPRKVIAGTTTGASNDGTFLLAKCIGGGQGYGMAVTIDGKPVAWGGTGMCDNGGMTGVGNTTAGIAPTYIKRAGNIIDNNVISINRGDTWGFYQTSDNNIYGWGCNIYGQLGIGSTVNQPFATAINPPSGCSFKDPKPTINLSPSDLLTCASRISASNPILLDNGFNIGTNLANRYLVRWYRNNVEVAGSPFTGISGKTYNATSVGTYKVTIEYTGTNGECVPYDIAQDDITISAYPKNFTTPSSLTYCGGTSIINVNSTGTGNPVYKFYPTATSSSVLGSTVGSGSTTIDLSTATAGNGSDKIVYVEETSQFSGIVLKKTQACDTSWSSFDYLGNNSPLNQSGFTTYSNNVNITSLAVRLKSEIYAPNSTLASTINFGIYGSKVANGMTMADDTKLLYSFFYNFSKTNTTSSALTTIETVKIPVNFTLPTTGIYFISLKANALTNSSGSGAISLGKGLCTQQLPISSIPSGYIAFTNNSSAFQFVNSQANQGQFFNVEFTTPQGYCDRIPVTLQQSCPCNAPATVTITSNPAAVGLPKSISICQGAGTIATLSGAYIKGTGTNTSNFYYAWYKKGTSPIYTNSGSQASGNATTGVPTLTSSQSSTGTYYLRVEDGNLGINACAKTDSVQVIVLPNTDPNCTITRISETYDVENTIRISPSPFKDQFTLETSGMEKVLVHDQRGVLIEEKSLVNLKNIQLGQTWSSGLYMLQLVGNGTVKTVKVIKEQ